MLALVALLCSAPAATGSTRVFKPSKATARTVTFKLPGLDSRLVVRASLVRGRREVRLSRSAAKRAAKKGKLKVKKAPFRKPPRLKVVVRKPPKTVVPPAVPPTVTDPPPVTVDPDPIVIDPPLDVIPPIKVVLPPVIVVPPAEEPVSSSLLTDPFSGADGVITNHHAFWSPNDTSAFRSPIWEMESGCALRKNETLWTGIPTANIPNDDCSNGSGSEIFRLWTKRSDFGDVKVTFSLRNNGYVSGAQGERSWDGIKIWLRRQGRSGSVGLYTAEVNRREGNLLIQKKCAGSDEYRILNQNRPEGAAARIGEWENVGGIVRNLPGGEVRLELIRHGETVLTATDTGGGCTPLTSDGRVGIRGDYTNFNVDDFVVSPAS